MGGEWGAPPELGRAGGCGSVVQGPGRAGGSECKEGTLGRGRSLGGAAHILDGGGHTCVQEDLGLLHLLQHRVHQHLAWHEQTWSQPRGLRGGIPQPLPPETQLPRAPHVPGPGASSSAGAGGSRSGCAGDRASVRGSRAIEGGGGWGGGTHHITAQPRLHLLVQLSQLCSLVPQLLAPVRRLVEMQLLQRPLPLPRAPQLLARAPCSEQGRDPGDSHEGPRENWEERTLMPGGQ